MNAILLVKGEKSKRLGAVKAFLKVQGRPLVEIMLDKLSAMFHRIYLVTTAPKEFAGYENQTVQVVPDGIKCGPLGGICLGLKKSDAAYNFVLAVDQVFLPLSLIDWMVKQEKGYQVLALKIRGQIQPLCAVYHKSVQTAMARRIRERKYRLTDFLKEVKTRYLEKELWKFGPPETLFFNINTPADLIKARKLAKGHQGG